MAWISLAALFVVLAVGCIIGTMWFDSYLRSRQLLELIAQTTGNAVRSDATFQPLRWTGSSAFSDQVTLSGRPGSSLREATVSQVRAELNWRAAFDGVWRIEDLAITQFDADFTAPEEAAAATSPPPQLPTGLLALLPRRFELAQTMIGSANLSFGQVRASGMHLRVVPNGAGWMIEGAGGTLATPYLPSLKISDFRARAQGGGLFLTESALRLGFAGKIKATGELGSGRFLLATWEEVDSKDILDVKMQRYLDGKLSGTADLRPPGILRGKIQLHEGRVENVPMLGVVADFTGNPAFRRMPLQEMSTDYYYEKGTLKLSNFVAESKGLLRVEGNGQRGADGQIEGRFQIGVTAQTLQWLPGSRERVFTIARNGYLWTDVVLGGTLENPTENLTARLTTAMGAAIIEQGVNLIKDPTKAIDGAKVLLNNDPTKAIDGAKGLLNKDPTKAIDGAAKGLLNNFIGPLGP